MTKTKRLVIATESAEPIDRRGAQCVPGALAMIVESVGVYYNNDFTTLWGIAKNLERDDTSGEVSLEVELFDDVDFDLDTPQLRAFPNISTDASYDDGGAMMITYAPIRAVNLYVYSGFPEMPELKKSSDPEPME